MATRKGFSFMTPRSPNDCRRQSFGDRGRSVDSDSGFQTLHHSDKLSGVNKKIREQSTRSRGQTVRRQPDMLEAVVRLHPGPLQIFWNDITSLKSTRTQSRSFCRRNLARSLLGLRRCRCCRSELHGSCRCYFRFRSDRLNGFGSRSRFINLRCWFCQLPLSQCVAELQLPNTCLVL